MDAEEKNSSNSFSEKNTSKTKCISQLHCFPEIKQNDIDKEECSYSESNNFIKNHSVENDVNSNYKSQPWPKVENNENEVELKALISQTYKEGFEAGFNDGINKEKLRIDELARTMEQALSELVVFKSKLLEKAEDSLLKLVMAIARKILLKEISVDREEIILLAQNALKMVVNPNKLIIRVNQKDMEVLNQNKIGLETVIGKTGVIKIESDAAISTGGCIVETDFGDIDARIESQLQMIEKAMISVKNKNKK